MLKKLAEISMIFLIFQIFFCTVLNAEITAIKPENLNNLYERRVKIIAETPGYYGQVSQKISDEIRDTHLEISTEILFSDAERVPVYAAPQKNSAVAAIINLPQEVNIVKQEGAYAKIELVDNKSGWILVRNIDCADYRQKYSQKIASLKQYFLNRDNIQPEAEAATTSVKEQKTDDPEKVIIKELFQDQTIVTFYQSSNNVEIVLNSEYQIKESSLLFNQKIISLQADGSLWRGNLPLALFAPEQNPLKIYLKNNKDELITIESLLDLKKEMEE